MSWSIAKLACELSSKLAVNRSESTASFEASYILGELLNLNRNELMIFKNDQVAEAIVKQAFEAIERREKNEPLQYIFSKAYFMELELKVNNQVLIPRPETEILVEWARRILPQNGRMLDIGCGSGSIALGVGFGRRDVKITGCDISPTALQVAESNRKKYQLENVKLVESDLFSEISGTFHLITANLPYISEEEYQECPYEVREFEPALALTCAEEGLALINKTIEQSSKFLAPQGKLALEIGETQAAKVSATLQQTKSFEDINVILDYNERPRLVIAQVKN